MKKELAYWKKRCELAEAYINESPCDPDIFPKQLRAWNKWRAQVNTTPPNAD